MILFLDHTLQNTFIFSIFQNNTVDLDFDYFVKLFEEYYLSDDPSDLGNFINGRLEFESNDSNDEEEEDFEPDPGLLDHRINSSTSIHSMDDDLRMDSGESNQTNFQKKIQIEKSGSTIRLHEIVKRKCQSFDCCVII